MKKYLSLLLVLLLPVFVFAQEEQEEEEFDEDYKSKEQDAYYHERIENYKPWEPLDENEIKAYKNAFFDYKETRRYKRYKPSKGVIPYYEYLKIMFEPGMGSIGNIDLRQILMNEKKENVEAIVYKDWKYENVSHGEAGIWVAYSQNNGDSWEYYYTGIVQCQPLFVKGDTKTPLIMDNGDLQVEVCLLRQMTRTIHPGPAATYELVKDGLLLTIDLETLRKDSDGDGLTDIVEAKFFTNPNDADTDGDGIPDNLDLNPRMNVTRTDKTAVYEAIINNKLSVSASPESDSLVPISLMPNVGYADAQTRTCLIVTDDPNLQAVQPESARVIILSEKEYQVARKYNDMLNEWSLSPLFKVDGEDDVYILHESMNTGGTDYVAKRVKNGWIVYAYSFWIS